MKENLKDYVDIDKELIKETMMLDYSQLVMHNVYMIKENKRLNNKLKDIKSQLDYLETYSSKEDVFEDMKRRLGRIDKIIGSDKE